MISFFEMCRKHCKEGESAGYLVMPVFFPCHTLFSKALFMMVVRSWDGIVKV